MAKGNKGGQPKKLTPELLEELFEEYKVDCKQNPKKENFFNAKFGGQVSVDREVPYSWYGFEVYLRKHGYVSRLQHYKANTNEAYSEFLYIIRAIDNEIKLDKLNGATAGIYQHNIIARELGLTDKKEVDATVKAYKVPKMKFKAIPKELMDDEEE